MLGKGVQHSVLAMVSQQSGHKANGSPIPLLKGIQKLNEVAGEVGKKHVA